MVDLSQLRSFAEVAERGTVAAAAEALGYSGPAVSLQLAKLERQLGTSLFDRVGGRLRLNQRGHRLLPIAQTMLDLAEEADRVGTATAAPPRHVVVAGFASALAAMVAPVMAGAGAGRSPGSVEVREAEDHVALRDLGLGHVDVALTQEYDDLPVARNGRYRYAPVGRDRLRLVAPASYPELVTVADLGGAPWLVNGRGTRCEAATQLILQRAGVSPSITGTVADNRALLALVAAGHGVTVVPELVLAQAPPELTVAGADLGISRTILAVTRASADGEHSELIAQLGQVLAGAG